MTLIIDTSGSMANEEDGITKIDLAAEAAIRVTESLNLGDILLVIGYSAGPDITIGPLNIDMRYDVAQEIYTLSAGGGGIFIYESLDYALRLLRDLSPDSDYQQHILVLADGGDSEHQQGALNLAAEAVESEISISAVSIGGGVDVGFLSTLSDAGSGRFYLAERASDLPAIFTEEVARVKRSYIVEHVFYPQLQTSWAPVAHLKTFPPLSGYIATSPKPRADVVWYAGERDPLLAVWQYGLGRTVAWTSDATNRWSANWLNWEEYVPFWNSLVREVVMPEMDSDVDVKVSIDHRAAHIVADVGDNSDVNQVDLDLHLQFSSKDQTEYGRSVQLEQVAPGRYEGWQAGLTRQPYLVRLYGDKNLVFGWTPPPAKEYLPGDIDAAVARLAVQSGGRVIQSVDTVVERNITNLDEGAPLALPLLVFSAFLWVLDIAWRRLGLTWKVISALLMRMLTGIKIQLRLIRKQDVQEATNSPGYNISDDLGKGVDLENLSASKSTNTMTRSHTAKVDVDQPDLQQPNIAARLRKRMGNNKEANDKK